MYFDGQTDLRPDFRLSRSTVAKLIDVLRSPFDHGWDLEVEVLVYLFWLASGTSYRVVSRGFSIPRSTVFDIIHRMSDKVLSLKNRTIKFPSLEDIPNIAAGFQRLSGSPALRNVVGSIDGMVTAWNPQKMHLGQMTLVKCSQTYNVESKFGTDSLLPSTPGSYHAAAGVCVLMALVPPPLSLTHHQVSPGLNVRSLTSNGPPPRLRQRGMGAEWRACHLLPHP
ncbi:hypothetical protein D4764_0013880 [Takifugu flavidus]|uniref:DDE Tnp4 domain-containing protein n=1 Tax=Takifugu flavidus TaxID=433684 RepID=A0A5C6MFH8_9TELE|nr:hypothetical protein D4764_0013880 [Takifugu flavidus]